MKKVAVVTGTSTGIGLETAVSLAKVDYKVYATMRNLDKAGPLKERINAENLDIELAELDVISEASVNACFEAILEREGRLDVLINNAGMGFLRTAEQATDAEISQVFETNVFGVMRCVRSVLPAMRAQHSGHLVFISSVGGLVGQPFNEIYCSSKFALEGYAETLATYLEPFFGISVSLIEPAAVASEFSNNVLSSLQQTGGFRDDAYSPIITAYLNRFRSRSGQSGQTPADIAKVVLQTLATRPAPVRVRTSDFAEQFCHFKTETDPDGLQQTAAIRALQLGV
ncbi:SDR family oxidoreductase [soil metagenome]